MADPDRQAGRGDQAPTWTIGGERIRRIEAHFYPSYIDEHVRFDAWVRSYLRPGMSVLDAGAGRGLRYPHRIRDTASRVAGADLDPAVLENPGLTDAVVADLADLPYEDASFDVIVSKYVFEHLAAPLATMVELRRVLRPGGCLLIHTPNRWHYVTIAARCTPTRFHTWFNEHRERSAADTFPTRYRANDRRTLSRLADRSGFTIERFVAIETKPDYLFFSSVAYRMGVGYERIVNRWHVLAPLRVQLLVTMRAVGGGPDA